MSTSNAGVTGNTNENTLRAPTNSNPVIVSLRASIDASGTVNILTDAGNTVHNVVVCATAATAAAFYEDGSHGVIEYWEPSSARGTIVGAALDSAARARIVTPVTNTAAALQGSLTASLDGSGAAPFNAYAGIANYTTFSSVGELALALHAEYLFGHPQATAAIDNDIALVNHFNATGSGADLAVRLYNAIKALGDGAAAGIANQVISQDPTRTAGADNTARNPDVRQALPFYSGDTVYVSIVFKQPALTSSAALPAGSSSAFPSGGAQLTFQITLN
jgi:hypothetical protein